MSYRDKPEYKARVREYMRTYMRKRRASCPGVYDQERISQKYYNFSIKEYNDLFALQNGLCRGCYRHQSHFKRRLAINHDHKTGRIRGLLCSPCNLALGHCNDDPQVLRRLADYIDKSIQK